MSWEGVDSPDLARLVSYADDTRLVVNCYNFGERPVECAMRLWRLQSGTYEVAVGADLDDDGAIDADAVRDVATVPLSRFSTVPINVPAGQNTIVSINRIGAVEHPAQLADLAISHEDIQIDGNTVTVTVHNLGAEAAENVQVALIDRKGIVLAEERIAHIDTPRNDLAARRTTVTITTKGESVVESVFVDPGDIVAEVFEENNEVTLER